MDDELQKHTLNLFEGDYEKLRELYPDIGAGAVIRRIVRRYIEADRLEERLREWVVSGEADELVALLKGRTESTFTRHVLSLIASTRAEVTA